MNKINNFFNQHAEELSFIGHGVMIHYHLLVFVFAIIMMLVKVIVAGSFYLDSAMYFQSILAILSLCCFVIYHGGFRRTDSSQPTVQGRAFVVLEISFWIVPWLYWYLMFRIASLEQSFLYTLVTIIFVGIYLFCAYCWFHFVSKTVR